VVKPGLEMICFANAAASLSGDARQHDVLDRGSRRTVSLMGIPIDRLTEAEVVQRIISAIESGCGGWVVTPNVDHLRILHEQPKLRDMLEDASLMVPDGMPLIWASRLQKTPLPERVAGASLILSLSSAAARIGAKVFLLGRR
jgi:N-acetylglucosaminyldiphosphoundecaprenol N-acetyl-beta-D-mannosaminyltransferase